MPTHNDEQAAQAAARRQRLQDLWQRRDRLSEAEWTALYTMTYHLLIPPSGQNIGLLAKLPEATELYVADFFTEKVFRPTVRENFNAQFIYPSTLRRFFGNYLLDRLDEVNHQPRQENLQDPLSNTTGDPEQDDSLLDHLSPEHFHPHWQQPTQQDLWLLWEAGLDEATVTASARAFIQRLTPDEYAVFQQNLVEGHKLSTLKATLSDVYGIASRLGLGINRKKFPEYRQTRIGQWLSQPPDADPPGLGLLLDPEDQDLFLLIVQILRNTALAETNRKPPASASGTS